MPKEDWGTKRVCPTTGRRFYDLNKTPIVSPYTGETVTIDTGKGRSLVADKADRATKTAKKVEEETEEDVVLLDDDDDDAEEADADLGDDVLEEDDDDAVEVSLDEIADVADDNDDT